MKIEIFYSETCGYTVEVDGETLLECLSEEEVNELSTKEIMQLMKLAKEI